MVDLSHLDAAITRLVTRANEQDKRITELEAKVAAGGDSSADQAKIDEMAGRVDAAFGSDQTADNAQHTGL